MANSLSSPSFSSTIHPFCHSLCSKYIIILCPYMGLTYKHIPTHVQSFRYIQKSTQRLELAFFIPTFYPLSKFSLSRSGKSRNFSFSWACAKSSFQQHHMLLAFWKKLSIFLSEFYTRSQCESKTFAAFSKAISKKISDLFDIILWKEDKIFKWLYIIPTYYV